MKGYQSQEELDRQWQPAAHCRISGNNQMQLELRIAILALTVFLSACLTSRNPTTYGVNLSPVPVRKEKVEKACHGQTQTGGQVQASLEECQRKLLGNDYYEGLKLGTER
ncbi:hypothetical protein [Turneriella parva]|uniref:hypothetical protein n=1 Tax=Turneriella parva TaxID=29510 RepID=UPI0005A500DE|nr:hypothetical protein [Turneriella parva]